jgi:glyoxylase I family protein
MFQGLEHTAIASPSPRTLAQWYVDHLGFRINFEAEGNFFVRAENGSMMEIIQAEGPSVEPKFRDPGIRRLAIAVTDFDAAYAALQSQRVKFLGDPYLSMGNQVVFFHDCDGNIVHLIKRARPLP